MAKSWYGIRNAAKGEAQIDLYSEIGAWGVQAVDFIRSVKALGELSSITVNINSPGGAVFDGIAIHNFLQRHPARVTCRVDGIAASIASVIAMAGDELVMPENAMLMIHDPSGYAVGTADDMRDLADALDKIKACLVAAYRQKSGLGDDEIAAMMSEETWLTAAEAKAKGFCDRVVQPAKMAALGDLSRFKNLPAPLAELAARAPESEAPPASAAAGGDPPEPLTPEDDMSEKKDPAGATSAVASDHADQRPTDAAGGATGAAQQPEAAKAGPSAAEERARATAIMQMCAAARLPGKAIDFIAKGTRLEDVSAALADAVASAAGAGEISGVHAAAGGQGAAGAAAAAAAAGWDAIFAKASAHRSRAKAAR